jgi:hypothetical protein
MDKPKNLTKYSGKVPLSQDCALSKKIPQKMAVDRKTAQATV